MQGQHLKNENRPSILCNLCVKLTEGTVPIQVECGLLTHETKG